MKEPSNQAIVSAPPRTKSLPNGRSVEDKSAGGLHLPGHMGVAVGGQGLEKEQRQAKGREEKIAEGSHANGTGDGIEDKPKAAVPMVERLARVRKLANPGRLLSESQQSKLDGWQKLERSILQRLMLEQAGGVNAVPREAPVQNTAVGSVSQPAAQSAAPPAFDRPGAQCPVQETQPKDYFLIGGVGSGLPQPVLSSSSNPQPPPMNPPPLDQGASLKLKLCPQPDVAPSSESCPALGEAQTPPISRSSESAQPKETVSTVLLQPNRSPATSQPKVSQPVADTHDPRSIIRESGSGTAQETPQKAPQPSLPVAAENGSLTPACRRVDDLDASKPLGPSEPLQQPSSGNSPKGLEPSFAKQHKEVEARLALLYKKLGCKEVKDGATRGTANGVSLALDNGLRTPVQPLGVGDLVELELPNLASSGSVSPERGGLSSRDTQGLATLSKHSAEGVRKDAAEPDGKCEPLGAKGQVVFPVGGESGGVENGKDEAGVAESVGGVSWMQLEGARDVGRLENGQAAAAAGNGGEAAAKAVGPSKRSEGVVQQALDRRTKGTFSSPEGQEGGDGVEQVSPDGESPDAGKENRGFGGVQRDGSMGASGGGAESQERSVKGGKAAEERKEIVQCDECGKLRVLGREGLVLWKELGGQDWWTCEMAGGRASCDDPEGAEVDTFNVLRPREERVLTDRNSIPAASPTKSKVSASPSRRLTLTSPSKPHKKVKPSSGKDGKGSLVRLGQMLKHGGAEGSADAKGSGQPGVSDGTSLQEDNQEGHRLQVPSGFSLVFTPRNTEKSVALNAPGDL